MEMVTLLQQLLYRHYTALFRVGINEAVESIVLELRNSHPQIASQSVHDTNGASDNT